MELRSKCLNFYKQRWVLQAISQNSQSRESAFRYDEAGFGNRPDLISYPNDVLEMAKKGATSYHISEERWRNPLNLVPGMRRKELDDMRIAWDFIIDIDSKDWRLSKVAAWLVFKVLKEEGISNVSAKFSGNKGFHIGVPWESFPQEIDGKPTLNSFPEFPKALAGYIVKVIKDRYLEITDEYVDIAGKLRLPIKELKAMMKEEDKSLYQLKCVDCEAILTASPKSYYEYICPHCDAKVREEKEEAYKVCECGKMMEKFFVEVAVCKCKSTKKPKAEFNVLSIIDVDTLLISSRHMYRSVYSLNEKSELVSIPVKFEDILTFDKKRANPVDLKPSELIFLDSSKSVSGEATALLRKSIQELDRVEALDKQRKEDFAKRIPAKLKGAIPKELFPPCISKILDGIPDGRKRAMFILTNFLRNCGWTDDMIEKELNEWSERCPEPLRQNFLVGHIRGLRNKTEAILPPNCNNQAYYISFGVCKSDGICKMIKNPVNYARRKYFFKNKRG